MDLLNNKYRFDYITKFRGSGGKHNISNAYATQQLSKHRLLVAEYWKIMKDEKSTPARSLIAKFFKKIALPREDAYLLKNPDPISDLCKKHHFVYGCRFDADDEPHPIMICKCCLTWYRGEFTEEPYEAGINRSVVNSIKIERRRIVEHMSLLSSFVK